MPSVAAMIVARNAASTIGCAVQSALEEPIDELLLVDDDSSDATLDVARSFGDSRIRILSIDSHSTLGYARHFGLSKLKSDFCFLLDADDSFLPGRIARLTSVLEKDGLDFVSDEIELVDGETGNFLRLLTIPRFLDKPPGLIRLFERNYLPGIGQIGFRVEFMRRIGYDIDAHGVEDTDLVLRALLGGARYQLVREVGYRMSHSNGSVSRNRIRQNAELASVLKKYDSKSIRELWLSSKASEKLFLWAMVSLEVFRRNWKAAWEWLSDLESVSYDGSLVLEQDGPCPRSESWRINFFKGALTLLSNGKSSSALGFCSEACEIQEMAEAVNNHGVALCRMGRRFEAIDRFKQSLQLRPNYSDAAENLRTEGLADRVTSHPLRIEPSRSEYSL